MIRNKCHAVAGDEAKICLSCGHTLPVSDKTGQHKHEEQTIPTRVRVGGWLTLFCVLLTIVFPLVALSGIGSATDLSAPRSGVDKDIASVTIVSALGHLFVAGYAFFCGLSIWRGSPYGKKKAQVFLILYPVITFFFNSAGLFGFDDAKGIGSVRIDLALDIFWKITFSSIWLFYFRYSKRVKMTYEQSA